MGRSLQQPLPAMELKRVEKRIGRPINKVEDDLAVPMRMAKAAIGAAIGVAIGDSPDKHFGDKGLVSNVKSGRGVPDYLARIYADDDACVRLALALLKGKRQVKVNRHITIDIDE